MTWAKPAAMNGAYTVGIASGTHQKHTRALITRITRPSQLKNIRVSLRVTQPTEPTTQLQKEIDIDMAEDGTAVRVIHRLRNNGLWPVELAPWGLSVMTVGGTAVVPFPPRGSHPEALLPANTLTLWPYTDMTDPRWTWGERYILLRQDASATTPQKVGVDVPDEWGAYVLNGFCFMKLFNKLYGSIYPDGGCTLETFTNDFMLELETLGPLQKLPPGETLEHTEDWVLFRDVQTPTNDDEADQYIAPLVQQARSMIES